MEYIISSIHCNRQTNTRITNCLLYTSTPVLQGCETIHLHVSLIPILGKRVTCVTILSPISQRNNLGTIQHGFQQHAIHLVIRQRIPLLFFLHLLFDRIHLTLRGVRYSYLRRCLLYTSTRTAKHSLILLDVTVLVLQEQQLLL